jgi:tetratricopeptide (TPR) repeat protein
MSVTSPPSPLASLLSRRTLLLTAAALALAVGAAIAVFVVRDGSPPVVVRGESAPVTGARATTTDARIAALEDQVADRPTLEGYLELSAAYLQKVRETGDPTLYGSAAEAVAEAAAINPAHGDVLAAQASVALALHDFEGALTIAQQALVTDPERARYYGLVGDAELELGRYDEAIASYQEMVNRRPDFASFSRVAFVRELYGDYEGAILAFEAAIDAGSDVPENMAWARVQLGNLSFAIGNYREADLQYARALVDYPGYPTALAAQARLAAANGDLAAAEPLAQQALDRMPLSEHAILLGDIQAKAGKPAEAQASYDLALAIDRLQSDNGVNVDLEVSLFLSDHGVSPAESLERARRAYDARPSIHAADALAWALYQAGQPAEAQEYAAEALRTGSREALKLFHAGMIAKTNGQPEQAFLYLEEALRLNPNFSLIHAEAARAALQEVLP